MGEEWDGTERRTGKDRRRGPRRTEYVTVRQMHRYLASILAPVLLGFVAIFVVGVVMNARYADQRVTDIETEAGENRHIIEVLVDAICEETKAERIDVRDLFQRIGEELSEDAQAFIADLLETSLPEERECLAEVLLALNAAQEGDADTSIRPDPTG